MWAEVLQKSSLAICIYDLNLNVCSRIDLTKKFLGEKILKNDKIDCTFSAHIGLSKLHSRSIHIV